MNEPMDEQHRRVVQLAAGNALHPWDLWIEYVALAGSATESEVADYMHGKGNLRPLERDLIDMALATLLESDWNQHPYGRFLTLAETASLDDDH